MDTGLNRDYYFARSWLPQLLDADEVLSLRSSPVSNIVALYKPAFEQTYKYGPHAQAMLDAAEAVKRAWHAANGRKRYELISEFLYLGYRESNLHVDAHKKMMQLPDVQYRIEIELGALKNRATPGHPSIGVTYSDSIIFSQMDELQKLVISTWAFDKACVDLKAAKQPHIPELEEVGKYFSVGIMIYMVSFLAQDILFFNPSFKDIVFNLEQFSLATELELSELKTDSLVR